MTTPLRPAGSAVLVRPEPTQLHQLPFPHAVFDPGALLAPATAARLAATFPAGLLRTATTAGQERRSDKTYAVNAFTLHHHGRTAPEADRLDDSWRRLTGELAAPDYGRRICKLLGLPDADITVELRLTEYVRGGWMSRHTDRPDKAFSQNIYLCPGWRPQWGGGLGLYAEPRQALPVRTFTPGGGNSLAFARSDDSWHEVFPVTAQARAPRRALLVHAYWGRP
ncbi:2OG-Fe(II) oxygenase [Streptomyces monticola]|uniref:2OG-Fe(II) oxygenase n=1 Tax=Streptomyces monticola TaxID=2666263 RepID=A0ABW2JG18_9ACTN